MTFFDRVGRSVKPNSTSIRYCQRARLSPRFRPELKGLVEQVKNSERNSQRRIETNPLRVLDSKLEHESHLATLPLTPLICALTAPHTTPRCSANSNCASFLARNWRRCADSTTTCVPISRLLPRNRSQSVCGCCRTTVLWIGSVARQRKASASRLAKTADSFVCRRVAKACATRPQGISRWWVSAPMPPLFRAAKDRTQRWIQRRIGLRRGEEGGGNQNSQSARTRRKLGSRYALSSSIRKSRKAPGL